MTRRYNEKKEYVCERCGETFRLQYNFAEHMKKHENESKNTRRLLRRK